MLQSEAVQYFSLHNNNHEHYRSLGSNKQRNKFYMLLLVRYFGNFDALLVFLTEQIEHKTINVVSLLTAIWSISLQF